jgi:hypothetical protein
VLHSRVALCAQAKRWLGFFAEEAMNTRPHKKLIHEGHYAAEVDVQLLESETGWSPTLTLEDAEKLDEVRRALRCGDLKRAAQLSRVFELTPVSAWQTWSSNSVKSMPLMVKLQKRIAKEMAAGKYRSAEEMMVRRSIRWPSAGLPSRALPADWQA